jgi:hypothetical protein
MCWGSVGGLGNGTPQYTTEPSLVANLTDAVGISTSNGSERTCARRANGSTVCWGTRSATGTDAVPVDEPKSRFAICSKPGSCARAWSGGWQRGDWTCKEKKGHVTCEMKFYERHGDGTSTGPEESWGNLDGIRDMRMPENSSFDQVCVADPKGLVYCFYAFQGAEDLVFVDGVEDAIQLAGSGEDTCALESSGIVKCWNERERHYLGGKVRTVNARDVVEIVGGSVHFCARYKNGTVGCWGYRPLLGDGADDHQTSAIVVPGVVVR